MLPTGIAGVTGEQVVEWFSTAEDFLLGRTTYEIFEAWWPNAPQEGDPIAGIDRRDGGAACAR